MKLIFNNSDIFSAMFTKINIFQDFKKIYSFSLEIDYSTITPEKALAIIKENILNPYDWQYFIKLQNDIIVLFKQIKTFSPAGFQLIINVSLNKLYFSILPKTNNSNLSGLQSKYTSFYYEDNLIKNLNTSNSEHTSGLTIFFNIEEYAGINPEEISKDYINNCLAYKIKRRKFNTEPDKYFALFKFGLTQDQLEEFFHKNSADFSTFEWLDKNILNKIKTIINLYQGKIVREHYDQENLTNISLGLKIDMDSFQLIIYESDKADCLDEHMENVVAWLSNTNTQAKQPQLSLTPIRTNLLNNSFIFFEDTIIPAKHANFDSAWAKEIFSYQVNIEQGTEKSSGKIFVWTYTNNDLKELEIEI